MGNFFSYPKKQNKSVRFSTSKEIIQIPFIDEQPIVSEPEAVSEPELKVVEQENPVVSSHEPVLETNQLQNEEELSELVVEKVIEQVIETEMEKTKQLKLVDSDTSLPPTSDAYDDLPPLIECDVVNSHILVPDITGCSSSTSTYTTTGCSPSHSISLSHTPDGNDYLPPLIDCDMINRPIPIPDSITNSIDNSESSSCIEEIITEISERGPVFPNSESASINEFKEEEEQKDENKTIIDKADDGDSEYEINSLNENDIKKVKDYLISKIEETENENINGDDDKEEDKEEDEDLSSDKQSDEIII